MNELQAPRLASRLTEKQRNDILTLAETIQKAAKGTCEHFDPITASCAPCCVVCSHFNADCSGKSNHQKLLIPHAKNLHGKVISVR